MPGGRAGYSADCRYDWGMKEPVHVPHQVLTAASHELRGPLGVARGYLRLLETQVSSDADALKSVTQAGRATEQMAALLDDLSRYARLARGEARLQPALTLLAPIVDAAIPRIARPVDSKVYVISEIPASLTVWTEPASTTEFCATMGTALARAAVEGGTLVFESRESSLDQHVEVTLRTSDATGGKAETRPARLDRSGMGLSLAVAELSVRLLGGALSECWVENRWSGYVLRLPTTAATSLPTISSQR
jgi:hypothetical protein